MALTSAEKMARSRAKQAGYEGKECPVALEDYSPEGLAVTGAWATGVWERQAEQMNHPRGADPK